MRWYRHKRLLQRTSTRRESVMSQLHRFDRDFRSSPSQVRTHPFHWISSLKVPTAFFLAGTVHKNDGDILSLDLSIHHVVIPRPQRGSVRNPSLKCQVRPVAYGAGAFVNV